MRSHSGDRLSWHPGAVLKQAASSLRFVLFLLLTGSCPWSLDLFPGPGEASLVNKHSFLFLPATKEKGSKVRGQQQRLCQEQTSAGEAVLARAESVPGFFLFV